MDKVAQIFNLPYRRFVIGRVADACWRFERTHPLQNAILRYGRLKICATLSLALKVKASIPAQRFTGGRGATNLVARLFIAMAFPLAHPAAVLPLRRYCPRWLSFPALVIGTLSPDAGYLFGAKDEDVFSHQLLGSIGFCLPVGLLMMVLIYALRSLVVKMLPEPYERALLPLCRRPFGSVWVVCISLLIGAWTHLLWDSLTHHDGWCVQHLPVLQSVVVSAAGRTARVCHVLWYGSSFAGVVWLVVVFEKWKQAHVNGGAGVSGKAVMRDAVLVAILLLPIELVHHFLRSHKLGLYLIAALCALPVMRIVLKMGNTRKGSAPNQPAAEGRDTV